MGEPKLDNCAVFWDIENVPIPKQVRPRDFTDKLRSSVLKPNGLNDEEFYCVCDTVKMAQCKYSSAEFFDGLNRAGVTMIHIQNCSKNAADEKIIDLMCKYVDKGGKNIILIAGDVNYVNHLRRFQSKSVKNYLVCPSYKSSSRDLISSAHKCYVIGKKPNGMIHFTPFATRDISSLPSSSFSKPGPCYVRITGFPAYLEAKSLRLFKQLIHATGGKILKDIHDFPNLWVMYKCSADAQRAVSKVNGLNFDRKSILSASYMEKIPFSLNCQRSSNPSSSPCPKSPWEDDDDQVTQLPMGAVNLSDDQPVFVEVTHDFDPSLVEVFFREVLPCTNGSIERSDGSKYLLKFSREHYAKLFIKNIDPLNKRTVNAHMNAKIVPAPRPIILRRDLSMSKPSSKDEVKETSDDVVYLGSSGVSSGNTQKSGKIYMSLTLNPTSGGLSSNLLEVLEQKGVFLIHQSSDSMWFKVNSRETGKKVMDRLSRHGYTTFLSERLPEELNCKFKGIRAWTIK